jgi:hypothetical protein
MNSRPLLLLVAGLVGMAGGLSASSLPPSPYLSFADSPFNGTVFDYFHLENFEDGLLNTPGVSVNAGMILLPQPLADSVDDDDGAIDGSGSGGRSFHMNQVTNHITFQFDALALGGLLPTHAGLVWTDVGFATPVDNFGLVEFEAFDGLGASLGVTSAAVGDGLKTGQTAEDRFFGTIYSGGISRIEIRMTNSSDFEIDHLQYGFAEAPEPSAMGLLGGLLAGLCAFRQVRKRRI